ncbi:MAG TPA: RNA polymerase sigma factor [Candidatus Dormibacteraeota bacterium]|nr:RNA polymerase sigma factor [Candidatus Dormibacteraeota bacterium]
MASKPLPTQDMLESEEDFGVAYEANARPIYRFFYWRTRDSELSEDLTSSVFEKAWRSRGSFHSGSVRAWLYRIARNLLIDHWRAKKDVLLTDEDSLPSQAEDISDILDKQIMAEQLNKALDKLPDEMRSVVRLRFIEGLPAKQVARIIGASEGNVRIIQFRALKKMRQYLDEQ